jgi:Repeat of Unknown Function (DUF347)
VLLALKGVPAVPNVLLFWLAFMLTRPLGATVGDFLTKPVAKGGLALGTLGSSGVLVAALFGLMAYAQMRERRAGCRQCDAAARRPWSVSGPTSSPRNRQAVRIAGSAPSMAS